ncbi:DUF171-domain-containing protein [Delitschia confertaspora ATCC 74209]|uniref:DUF171-domain-containing protein n=1 Tax=Delitschia confertaspora ATCC 74209 TaxID=1513339 RepID=A0A9P4JK69_9PLEO|nr:DUF171-domain-containing protein [Delitschia confertaspora ATCC 74209]
MAKDEDKKSKKRKRDVVVHQEETNNTDVASPKRGRSAMNQNEAQNELDTSKPSAVFQPKNGRPWTLSIALPGSFITNVSTYDQKASLACRIARACAVFCVDEIVVFDDDPHTIPQQTQQKVNSNNKGHKGSWSSVNKQTSKTKAEVLAEVSDIDEPWHNPDQFLFHVLSYLETPPHLRRYLFQHHPNLKGAGSFTSLDMPHHMRADEWCVYREGVTLENDSHSHGQQREQGEPEKKKKKSKKGEKEKEDVFTMVECGLSAPVRIPIELPPYVRVTVKFASQAPPPGFPNLSPDQVANLEVEATSPSDPREEGGYYWGYTVRRAATFSDIYTESPFENGYDISIGTSERGVPLKSLIPGLASSKGGKQLLPLSFNHAVMVFGGVAGLEPAIAGDATLAANGITKETAGEAFDYWVNLAPGQGSRTIRTEEAVWIGLAGIREYVGNM